MKPTSTSGGRGVSVATNKVHGGIVHRRFARVVKSENFPTHARLRRASGGPPAAAFGGPRLP
jgi:hypothetical protein